MPKFTTRQTSLPLWHYRCPECGFGDGETGYQAQTDAIYCEVCLEDSHHVRLQRWLAESLTPTSEDGER